MAKDRLQGKLAVILHADVAGSTQMVQQDEHLAHERIQNTFHRFGETIEKYSGQVLELRGDALLAEFERPSDAVIAALAFQGSQLDYLSILDDDLKPEVRVGIAMGEVVVADNTITGAGVVLAQRVEQLADPGDVCITAAIHEAVPRRLPLEQRDLGEKLFKGFDEPLRTYGVSLAPGKGAPEPDTGISRKTAFSNTPPILASIVLLLVVIGGSFFALNRPISESQETESQPPENVTSDRPSLVVLPFVNMSRDPDQEYFVDGVTEDIVTDISRLSNLTIIAWSTSSTYKGTQMQPQEVGMELGVDYIVSGSLRKAGDQLRITTQLVDSSSGKAIWAERYDRQLIDIFTLQDEVRGEIVSALAVKLTKSEREELESSKTDNIAAYDAFLRGRRHFLERTREGYQMARQAYREAITHDPGYARAYGALAIVLTNEYRSNWTDISLDEARARALELANKAVRLDSSSPQTHWALGFVQLFRKEYDAAAASAQTTITLAPNYADGHGLLAFINNFRGRAEDAVRQIKKAMKLNPLYSYDYPWNLGRAYYTLGRYPEAIDALLQSLERNENAIYPRLFLAACYVRVDRQEDAEWEIQQIEVLNPNMTMTNISHTFPIADKNQLYEFLDDLRKAGLPD